MTDRFAGNVVIVTGGSRGIGRAIVEGFCHAGAQVLFAGRNAEVGNSVAHEISKSHARVEFCETDVSQRDEVERMVAHALESYGRIDVLVNNAGIHDSAPFCDEPPEMWQRLFEVNVLGTVLPSQAVVRHMMARKGGAIVHVASKAGVVGEPGHAAYSASKGAVISLTRAMAIELAPFAIRVNAVCPGPVATDMFYDAVPDEKTQIEIAAATPLGRVGLPADIAAAVLYLASTESDWVTGQALSLDGGLSILL